MQLDDAQLAQFQQQGYLFFPSLLDAGEVTQLQQAMPELLGREGPEVVREPQDPSAIRLVYGGHRYSRAFGRLSRLPRLLRPVQQLLADEVYIHQSRLNPKQDFGGGVWSWHQDFGTWHQVDGMPAPNCIMVAVFLDDASAVNAPLLIVPGSQHHGLIEDAQRDAQAQGYALFDIDRATLSRLANDSGIEALLGPAGSVAFLHCNIVHGSSNNISPWRRAIMYLNYNAVGNACLGQDRAWHHNNRDFTPLQPLPDDSLRQLG